MDIQKPPATSSVNSQADRSELRPEVVKGIPVRQPGATPLSEQPANSAITPEPAAVSADTAVDNVPDNQNHEIADEQPQGGPSSPSFDYHLVAVIAVAVLIFLGLVAATFFVFRHSTTADESVYLKIMAQPFV